MFPNKQTKPHSTEGVTMAQVLVCDRYRISLQAQDAKSFTNSEGKKIEIEAQAAREASVVICEYNEFRVPFILPVHFDENKDKIEIGSVLDITCNSLDDLRPLQIKNVNRVLPKKPANK